MKISICSLISKIEVKLQKIYIDKTEFFSEEELDNIVKEKLIEQIKYAYKYVPYYRKKYNENDVKTMDSLSDRYAYNNPQRNKYRR